jgi:carbon storage regulator
MLVLTRRVGEEIVIDGRVRVKVVAVHGKKARIGVTAPANVRVDRQEVHERLGQFADTPSQIDTVSVLAKRTRSKDALRAFIPSIL